MKGILLFHLFSFGFSLIAGYPAVEQHQKSVQFTRNRRAIEEDYSYITPPPPAQHTDASADDVPSAWAGFGLGIGAGHGAQIKKHLASTEQNVKIDAEETRQGKTISLAAADEHEQMEQEEIQQQQQQQQQKKVQKHKKEQAQHAEPWAGFGLGIGAGHGAQIVKQVENVDKIVPTEKYEHKTEMNNENEHLEQVMIIAKHKSITTTETDVNKGTHAEIEKTLVPIAVIYETVNQKEVTIKNENQKNNLKTTNEKMPVDIAYKHHEDTTEDMQQQQHQKQSIEKIALVIVSDAPIIGIQTSDKHETHENNEIESPIENQTHKTASIIDYATEKYIATKQQSEEHTTQHTMTKYNENEPTTTRTTTETIVTVVNEHHDDDDSDDDDTDDVNDHHYILDAPATLSHAIVALNGDEQKGDVRVNVDAVLGLGIDAGPANDIEKHLAVAETKIETVAEQPQNQNAQDFIRDEINAAASNHVTSIGFSVGAGHRIQNDENESANANANGIGGINGIGDAVTVGSITKITPVSDNVGYEHKYVAPVVADTNAAHVGPITHLISVAGHGLGIKN